MSEDLWQKAQFNEICDSLINGGTPSTSVDRFWAGNIPWITGADFTNQSIGVIRRHITQEAVNCSSTHVIRSGNILLVTRTGVGKVAIAPFDLAISQDITGLYLKDSVDVGFMYFCLQSHLDQLRKLNQGTSINGILKDDLLQYWIEVPPLNEQRKIAKILTTVNNVIEKTEALIAKYNAIKQGMMQDLFTRGVDENGELRPSYGEAPDLYKKSELGWIPVEWNVHPLTYAVPKAEYGISSTLSDTDEGIPVLRMNNLKDGSIVLDDIKFSTSLEALTLKLKFGDVLFNRTNSYEHVGRTSIWENEIELASFASYLVRLTTDPEVMTQQFLNMWLNLPETQIAIRKFATPAVHQVNINPTNLRKTPIKIPKIDEQNKIVKIIVTIQLKK